MSFTIVVQILNASLNNLWRCIKMRCTLRDIVCCLTLDRPFSRQRDIDKYSVFQKTKFIIKFVSSIIIKLQCFDEIGQNWRRCEYFKIFLRNFCEKMYWISVVTRPGVHANNTSNKPTMPPNISL